MSRIGKIARLDDGVRYHLNEGLRKGKPSKEILKWLNESPQAQESMRLYFDGAPITEQNLSEWRKGGYLEWLRNEEARDLVTRMFEETETLSMASENHEVSDLFGTRIAVEFTRLAQELLDKAKTPEERWERIKEMMPYLAQLRRAESRAANLSMKKQEWEWETEEHYRKEARRKVFNQI